MRSCRHPAGRRSLGTAADQHLLREAGQLAERRVGPPGPQLVVRKTMATGDWSNSASSSRRESPGLSITHRPDLHVNYQYEKSLSSKFTTASVVRPAAHRGRGPGSPGGAGSHFPRLGVPEGTVLRTLWVSVEHDGPCCFANGESGYSLMRFTVLGTLRATGGDATVVLPPKERTMLATLLLRAGRGRVRRRAGHAIWDDNPPPSARNTIQGRVSGFARRRPGIGRIVTRAPGYLIEVRPGELDLPFNGLRSRRGKRRRRTRGAVRQASCGRRSAVETASRWLSASAYLQRAEALAAGRTAAGRPCGRTEADLRLGRNGASRRICAGWAARHPFRERSGNN